MKLISIIAVEGGPQKQELQTLSTNLYHGGKWRYTAAYLPIMLQDLPRGSTQAIEYAMQLTAMMDAAVQAASNGARVEAFLEV